MFGRNISFYGNYWAHIGIKPIFCAQFRIKIIIDESLYY